ncbi:cytochrome P450, partial [Kibdelosporangium lantanae]
VLASPAFSNRIVHVHPPIERPGIEDMKIGEVPGMFNRMDGEAHARIRRMLIGQFTVRRMTALEPLISKITDDHLDAMERQGPPLDLIPAFTLPIPSLVICELLGVPQEMRGSFQDDAKSLFNLDAGGDAVMKGWMSLSRTMAALVTEKRAHPGDDLLSGLIAEGELTEQELVMIAMILLIAGHETTANMLALGTYTLLQHPDQRDALLKDPATAVEELLRYLSIIHIGPIRTALEDVEIDGHLIRAGDPVTISVPG